MGRFPSVSFSFLVSFGFLRFPSVSFGFLRFPLVFFGFLRFPSVSFGFLEYDQKQTGQTFPSASFLPNFNGFGGAGKKMTLSSIPLLEQARFPHKDIPLLELKKGCPNIPSLEPKQGGPAKCILLTTYFFAGSIWVCLVFGCLFFVVSKGNQKDPNLFGGSQLEKYKPILWMDKFLHHFETMGNHF